MLTRYSSQDPARNNAENNEAAIADFGRSHCSQASSQAKRLFRSHQMRGRYTKSTTKALRRREVGHNRRHLTATKMLSMPGTLPLLALSLFQTAAAAEQAADDCASLVPPALLARIATDLPAYQLPVSSDAGAQRLKDIATSGDWPCPFISLGDFDGNESLDRVLLLKSRQNSTARLIGALNNKGQWQISLSEDWPLALTDSELHSQEAGFYQREEAIRQPAAQLDQLVSLQAEYTGFIVGKVNGMQAMYAWVNGKWQKLTLRD